MKRSGRKQPYTEAGVRRLGCVRCDAPAVFQWQCCADGNIWRPICPPCDVELNAVVLKFMRDPDVVEKVAAYASAKGVQL